MKSIIDDQARRRFQQERHQQHFSYPNVDEREMTGPAFTFKLPMQPFGNVDEIPFAFGPSHPKFYEKNPTPTDNVLTYRKALSTDSDLVHFNSDGVSSHVVKAPMNVNPKINPFENENDESSNKMSKSNDVITREDWNKLVETLERKGQGKTIVNALQPFTQTRNDVAKKPVDLNSAWVIAVIAGVSAAFTVGLLAIGIGWYTYVFRNAIVVCCMLIHMFNFYSCTGFKRRQRLLPMLIILLMELLVSCKKSYIIHTYITCFVHFTMDFVVLYFVIRL